MNKIVLTGRTLKNFTDRTVNFTIRAKKICLDMINETVEARFEFLANMVNTDLTSVEKANIQLFCYDDFYKLYR